MLDLRYLVRGPIAPPPDYVVVAIDDRTLASLKSFPVPRPAIAAAVDRLTDAGAKVIAFDLLLLEHDPPSDGVDLSAGDAVLAKALQRNGHAILGSALSPDGRSGSNLDPDILARNSFAVVESSGTAPPPAVAAGSVLLPIDGFARVAALANVNVPRDADGTMRRIALAVPAGEGRFLPAMSLDAVRVMRDLPRSAVRLTYGVAVNLGIVEIPTDSESAIAINHYGEEGSFPTYSLIDVIEGKIAPERLVGRVVFLGSTALGFGDLFPSPFTDRLPGVEVLATAAANIGQERYLRRDQSTRVVDLVLAVLLGLLAFVAANLASLVRAALATIGLWALAAVGLQIAFSARYLWLDAITCMLVLAAVGLLAFAGRIGQQRHISGELQRERDNLARYQSPLLSSWLAEQQRPGFDDRAQHAAVMFVDLAGFTRRSEHLGPAATVGFLRDLHGRIERAALANRGVIEQFAGDGAMIIFGLPEPADDDAARALTAACRLIGELGEWSAMLQTQGQEEARLRIGLHYGPVIAARLGGERQRHVTVTGDTVNVASRLQEMGKQFQASIVASDDFMASARRAGAADPLPGMRRLGGHALRGHDASIDVWVWP